MSRSVLCCDDHISVIRITPSVRKQTKQRGKLTMGRTSPRVILAFSLLAGSAVLYAIYTFSSTIVKDSYAGRDFRRNDVQQPTAGSRDPFPQVEGFIIIFITSAPFHTERREAIRQTWLSLLAKNSVGLGRSNRRAIKDPTDATNNLIIHYLFVCGHSLERKVETALDNEVQAYGDILRLKYTEAYSHLLFKTLSSLRFASTRDVKFIVKVDDDVYVHVPRLTLWLKTASLPEKVYAGHLYSHSVVTRNTKNKYHVGKQYFNESFFPPYCSGPFYVLSTNAAIQLLKAASGDWLTDSFPLEDAYIGILARSVGLKPINLVGKGVLIVPKQPEKAWPGHKLNQLFALGHGLSIRRLFALHKRFLQLPLIMPQKKSDTLKRN